jgi:hypothetical protein
LLDTLMSEYGWSMEYAESRPLRRVLCLHATIATRHGHEWTGPSYTDRDI